MLSDLLQTQIIGALAWTNIVQMMAPLLVLGIVSWLMWGVIKEDLR